MHIMLSEALSFRQGYKITSSFETIRIGKNQGSYCAVMEKLLYLTLLCIAIFSTEKVMK